MLSVNSAAGTGTELLAVLDDVSVRQLLAILKSSVVKLAVVAVRVTSLESVQALPVMNLQRTLELQEREQAYYDQNVESTYLEKIGFHFC